MEKVAAFFWVERKLVYSSCELAQAEKYGDFLICSDSHYDLWEHLCATNERLKNHAYDYFPRERVVFRQPDGQFIVYIDRCLNTKPRKAAILAKFGLPENRTVYEFDEHYQCRKCNKNYYE